MITDSSAPSSGGDLSNEFVEISDAVGAMVVVDNATAGANITSHLLAVLAILFVSILIKTWCEESKSC